MEENTNLSAEWETIELKIKGSIVKYPLLMVKIWGKQNLINMIKLTRRINEMANNVKVDYISLTDFTRLDAGSLMKSLISVSMNKSLKTIIGVSNIAKISFVLFGEDSFTQMLKEKLAELNTEKTDFDYKYRYVFIKDKGEIKKKAEEILAGGGKRNEFISLKTEL